MNTLPPDYDPTYREKKFAVEIEPCRMPMVKNELKVSITHNGYQWESFSLSPEEAWKISRDLTGYLASRGL